MPRNDSAASIADLDTLVARLPDADRALFQRLFRLETALGQIVAPDTMRPWIERQFGSVEPVLRQKVVRVTNRFTLEEAAFNSLRERRPLAYADDTDIEAELARRDPFADPEAMTPADTFGRIEGRFCHTASNIAKFDGYHGLIIFREPHPLRFDRDQLRDYFATARRWFSAAFASDPRAVYPLLLWNCLHRAGASLLHGHMQAVLGRGAHYAGVLRQRRAWREYRERHGGDYFDDLYRVHEALDAAFRIGETRVIVSLTPVRSREVTLLAPEWAEALDDSVYDVLAHFRDDLGVRAFNVGVTPPPLADEAGEWRGFPTIARIVDRGDPRSPASDVAAMELFGMSVVSSDPFELAASLRKRMGGGP